MSGRKWRRKKTDTGKSVICAGLQLQTLIYGICCKGKTPALQRRLGPRLGSNSDVQREIPICCSGLSFYINICTVIILASVTHVFLFVLSWYRVYSVSNDNKAAVPFTFSMCISNYLCPFISSFSYWASKVLLVPSAGPPSFLCSRSDPREWMSDERSDRAALAHPQKRKKNGIPLDPPSSDRLVSLILPLRMWHCFKAGLSKLTH